MTTLRSSTHTRVLRWSIVHHASSALFAFTLSVAVAACGADGVLEPHRAAVRPPLAGQAAVIVTPTYWAFDTRSDFNSRGVIDQLNPFDEFTGGLVYQQDTPYTARGVTYTSDLNVIFGPGIGLGVQSNAMSTEFGAPLTATLGSGDAFTMFAADLTLIGDKTPAGLVILTNLGSYTFANLDVPLATSGQRFFGIALSAPGEYLTGFRFTVGGPNTTILLDNVAVGHATLNTNPRASAGGAYTGAEGSSVTLNLTASDADGDALAYSWNLGDGTTGSGSAPPASHTYADNGSYDIVLAVADGRGGVDTARTTATIANVAPSLAAFSLPETALALVDGEATFPVSTTFTDPGTADTHTATLDCGTGVTTQSAAPNGSAGGTCTFSSPGVYTVRLTVVDDDGGSDTKVASGEVVVYDAAAGAVTGGGWITSPVGGYALAPSIGGKLTFGFVARYQPGSTVPTGNAEFKLNGGPLDFRAKSFDWLVVGDANAQLQGRGTLNGAGDYAFSLMVVDGATSDAIRLRIWNRVSGAVVYDSRPEGELVGTQLLTTLGGGGVQTFTTR